jgi:polyhydroxybutyrate depolymerase
MMKYILFFLVVFSACTSHGQPVTDSILVEQHYRTFQYFAPSADIKGGSLLFLMHGSGGNSNDMIKHTKKLEAVSSKERLLIVYPDGYQHFWNECRKYSNAVTNKENINENAFFSAMIKYFQGKYRIDTNKVYAAGFSGGGQMAYKLGLTMPSQIKAIAAVVANLPDSASCDCVMSGKPLPVLIINGTDDPVNPYKGGKMFVNNASFGVVKSSENTFGYWATLAGYKGSPKKELLPDTDTSDHKIIEQYSYSKTGLPPITLLKVIGGKHDYPGDIDVYVYAWKFFQSIH